MQTNNEQSRHNRPRFVEYVRGEDITEQQKRIGRFVQTCGGEVIFRFSDPKRAGKGLIEAVRTAKLKGAALIVTRFDQLSRDPVVAGMLSVMVRVVTADKE